MIRIVRKIYDRCWRTLASPLKYAKHIGVKVGRNCFISTKDWGTEPYLIEVGNNVQIAHGVKIHTHGGGNVARRKYPDFDIFGRVIIEDWVYIGTLAQIMPGVTIGEGSLVAAGSVVTKSIPKGVVVGGNPARIICSVEEYIDKNLKYNTHTKGKSAIEKRAILERLPNEKFIVKRCLK